MTFLEFLLEKSLIEPNVADRKGKKINSRRNVYKEPGAGAGKGVSNQTAEIRDTKTGKVYGRKTIYMKEGLRRPKTKRYEATKLQRYQDLLSRAAENAEDEAILNDEAWMLINEYIPHVPQRMKKEVASFIEAWFGPESDDWMSQSELDAVAQRWASHGTFPALPIHP